MLTVHHLETSRSQRILWLLEELGVPYTLKRYQRDPHTRLAPPELRQVHPLGKSPVITDGEDVIAESGAIIEHLADLYGAGASGELGDLGQLVPARGTPEHRQCRFWMHYAEGSLMNWLMLKLVFNTLPRQPMPFFARPIARGICDKASRKLVDPNLSTALAFMNDHLSRSTWFAGDAITIADFQMSFPVEAALTRVKNVDQYQHVHALRERMRARPAYQRALEKGGPVVMSS